MQDMLMEPDTNIKIHRWV